MTAREQAARSLTHYLKTAWTAAGLTWNSDNDAEVTELVDSLIVAARVVGD